MRVAVSNARDDLEPNQLSSSIRSSSRTVACGQRLARPVTCINLDVSVYGLPVPCRSVAGLNATLATAHAVLRVYSSIAFGDL